MENLSSIGLSGTEWTQAAYDYGVEGKNHMRYRSGLWGGVWLTSLASDLGNGKFDGANLVAGFEDLNPAIWNRS